ncbi:hypothetical protein EDD21DRAFT_436632, partial [Dissophora ornata]
RRAAVVCLFLVVFCFLSVIFANLHRLDINTQITHTGSPKTHNKQFTLEPLPPYIISQTRWPVHYLAPAFSQKPFSAKTSTTLISLLPSPQLVWIPSSTPVSASKATLLRCIAVPPVGRPTISRMEMAPGYSWMLAIKNIRIDICT